MSIDTEAPGGPLPVVTTSQEVFSLEDVLEVQVDVQAALEAAKGAKEVTDEETAGIATEILGQLAAARKRSEDVRKARVKPYNDATTQINGAFKEMMGPVAGAEAALKKQIAEHHEREQARIDAEQKRLEENARRRQERADKRAEEEGTEAKQHQAPQLPSAQTTRRASSGAATVTKRWKYRITDESKLPREYLVPDEKKIGAELRERKGDLAIPGVEPYQESGVAVR